MKSTRRMNGGIKPPSFLPGRAELGDVGRPKKYLRGPALVMIHDTARVPIVARIRMIGKDPKIKVLKREDSS